MMSAPSLGARPWPAPPTTAIRLTRRIALLAAAGAIGPAAAASSGPAIDRLYGAATLYAPAAPGLPARAEIDRRCGEDAHCAAEVIADAFAGRALLEPVDHPDSDSIRLVKTEPSLGRVGPVAGGRLMVALDRFGRNAVHELRDAVGDAPSLILDLRANRGGALERMLRVAALFTGPIDAALGVNGRDGRRVLAIPDSRDRLARLHITVLVGRHTASSAEMLAALLRRHGDAEIVGETTFGKDYVYRVIPVDHDWRLLIPAERIDIPGETLAGGLTPDRPAPQTW